MAKRLLLIAVFTLILTSVLCIPKNHATENKKTAKRYDDYWGNYYDWDYYWPTYDYYWNDDYYDYPYKWGECAEGKVQCISDTCVDVDDLCTGLDSCSSLENDYLCYDYYYYYYYYIRSTRKASQKRGTGKELDKKVLKAKAYQMAISHPIRGKDGKRQPMKVKLGDRKMKDTKVENKEDSKFERKYNNLERLLKSLKEKHAK